MAEAKEETKENSKPTNSPLFITEEQFNKAIEAQTKLFNEGFKSVHQETLDKLTETLKVIIPQKPAEPTAPVEGNKGGDDRISKFKTRRDKVVEWFKKAKSEEAEEIGNVKWVVPKDLFMSAGGYNHDADTRKATEDLTYSFPTDVPQKYVKRFILLRGGRWAVPIRQYCDFQVLEGEGTVNWYTFDGYDFGAVTEGVAPSAVSQAIERIPASPDIRGAFQKIGYSQIEDSPAPLIDAINAQAVIAGLEDEGKKLFAVTAAASPDDHDNWVDGEGSQVSAYANDHPLLVEGVLGAKKALADNLGQMPVGNTVLFLNTQQRDELFKDVVSYVQFVRATEVDLDVMERVLGVDIVVTNNVHTESTTDYDAVLAVKGEAFGLASARDITLEAQRRNELQQVFITANQRIVAAEINAEAWVRISTKQ
jgi:hypothetical protein